MAAATSILAAAALAGTAYQVYSGEEQKKAMRSKEDDARKEASRLQLEADNATAISEETANQQKARARQKMMAGSAGPAGTLLGSGLGNIQPTTSIGSGPGKTKLGS